MSEVLLIRLGSRCGDVIPWLVWSQAEQEIIASGEVDDADALGSLTQHAQGRDVRVLVPSCDVTMKTVPLPGKFNRQLQAALPFMLEDDLTEDVDGLFFAIGDKTTLDGKPAINVAVVSRHLMNNWLDWLKAADIHSTTFIPDALCLPQYDTGPCGIELNQQWLVRTSDWQCNSIDSVWFDQYLQLSASQFEAAQDEDSEAVFTFITHSPCLAQADNLVVTEVDAELPLKLLLNNAQSSSFNLLQGDFVVKKEGNKTWKVWQQAAVIAVVAIVLQLAFRGTVAWQLSSELDREKAAFIGQFKKAFPGDRTRSGLIERQLKNRLKAAQGGSGTDSGFLAMLGEVAPLFSKNDGFVPNVIKFDAKRNELRLNATGDGFQSFEKFKSAVQKMGFTVQQGSLSNDGDKVAGTIAIKRAG